jgi:HEAT repeat protein
MDDSILQNLAGGDRRSTGRSDEVAAQARANPSLLPALVDGMCSTDPLIRMRAADALEKATADCPERLQPFAGAILEVASTTGQQEVRWHAAQLLPRIAWNPAEYAQVIRVLESYLQDRSRIVVTFSLQALADFSRTDPLLRKQVVPLLDQMLNSPAAAVRSRAARLLRDLNPTQGLDPK